MHRAITLSKKGLGWVNPNPLVGAVLVKEGRVIGDGFHDHFGAAHAEVVALEQATESVEGATLYVTLEPCSHFGKTPPCAPLLVEKGIGRVVVAMLDPNPEVNGRGVELLKSKGIDVTVGVLEAEVRDLNAIFIKYITTQLPFVLLKTAMTLDGKIATVTNASRWISGEKSRKFVHTLRQQYSGILVGVDTVLYDNPLLTTRRRSKSNHHPFKIIADTRCRISLDSNVIKVNPQLAIVATTELADKAAIKQLERCGAQVIVCPLKDGKVDLTYLMMALGTMGIDSVLVEGGSTLSFTLLTEGLIDKVISFIAPKILGGKDAPTPVGGKGIKNMDQALQLQSMKMKKMGEDIMIEGNIRKV